MRRERESRFFRQQRNAIHVLVLYIAANTWSVAPTFRKPRKTELHLLGYANYVYFVRGNSYQKFYRLNLTTNLWGFCLILLQLASRARP